MEQTVIYFFWKNVKEKGNRLALMTKEAGRWREIPFREFGDIVTALASSLIDMGIHKGDKVAIISQTRYEWTLSDTSILTLGAATVPIYPTVKEDEVKYILANSDSRLAFVEDKGQLQKVLKIKSDLPLLDRIVIFDPKGAPSDSAVVSFATFLEQGRSEAAQFAPVILEHAAKIAMDDLATIVYTSGTTGLPKGGMISHKNIMFNLRALGSLVETLQEDRAVAYLPLSHVYERINEFNALYRGTAYCFAESIDKMVENLADIQPAVMPGVPRVYEKMYTRVTEQIQAGPPLKRAIFNWAQSVGKRAIPYRMEGRPMPIGLKIQLALANGLVFKKIKDKFGGKLRYCISAAAPISQEVIEFFLSLDIPMYEGFGMTETMAPTSLNTPTASKLGTVGRVFPGVEVKIAPDGEILLKGDNVISGYYKLPEETAETFADGWLHTGDLGEIDKDGFLKITGRKKELIITSGAKHVAPNKLENIFSLNPFIGQFVPYGDNRKFISAIVSLEQEAIEPWATQQGIKYSSFAELSQYPKVRELIQGIIEEGNKQLAQFETIKKFIVSDHPFSIDTGELTPTLKVKKKVVYERYMPQLDDLYRE